MLPDHVSAALHTLRIADLTPHQRRKLAEEMRRIADRHDRIAVADERVGHVVRRERNAIPEHRESALPGSAHPKGGRPRGSGAMFIRWKEYQNRSGGRLYIGRSLIENLGSPARMNIERLGDVIWLRIAGPGEGWAVVYPSNQGTPRMSIGDDAALSLGLIEGRWPALVVNNAIKAPMGRLQPIDASSLT